MAILIKDMEMPKNCMACDFEQVDEYELYTECSLIYKGHTYKCRTEGRLPDCPLVETPDTQSDDIISRQATCEYCHEDFEGYVKPIEKNCHAFVRFGMDGWELSLKANGWHGSAKIRYCPMCGRDLFVKRGVK